MKHRENNEIDDHELGPYIADSVRLAEEIGRQDSSAVRMLENDEDDEDETPQEEQKEKNEEDLKVRLDDCKEYGEQGQQQEVRHSEPSDEDKNSDLIVDEEEKIAIKLRRNANLSGKTFYFCLFLVVLIQIFDYPSFTVSSKSDEVVSGLHHLQDVESNSTKEVTSSLKGEDAANENPLHLKIVCDLCPMTFNRWSLLYVHRCAHTGETPIFKCSVCTVEFSSIEG
jgi:hypothetical protein